MTSFHHLSNRLALGGIGVAAALALSGCAGLGKSPTTKLPVPDAVAQLVDARGADRGHVDIFKDNSGLRIEVIARGFAAGSYGMHIHTTGQCVGPDFTSAGGHWNPTGAQHGRDNPLGAHHGDLPNLEIAPDTIGRASFKLVGTPLTGPEGLLDADGAAIVIHAGPDDMKTDPSGNSGARVACGVITLPSAGG